MARVYAHIGSPGTDFASQWDRLVRRARPNAFLSPPALKVVHETGFAKLHVLLAWTEDGAQRRLTGVWALRECPLAFNGFTYLATPAYDYAFLSNPVVDPEFMDETVEAFFEAIDRNPALPNVMGLKYLDKECPTYPAIDRALIKREAACLKLSERARPFVSKGFGRKQSGSTRKKLRQHWNRLAKVGAVEVVNDRTPAAVAKAFETFLALEAASWKGERGTAIKASPADEVFAKTFLSSLAAGGNASVGLLCVGGRPIAAQVLLYSGKLAYTWKTAFDLEFKDYSPGVLLVDRLTEDLFEKEGVEEIESCSPEGGFLSQVWDGSRGTINLLADVGARKSLNFILVAAFERGYLQLKQFRNRLRSHSR